MAEQRSRISGGLGTGMISVSWDLGLLRSRRDLPIMRDFTVSGNVIGFNSVRFPTAFITSTAAANIKFGALCRRRIASRANAKRPKRRSQALPILRAQIGQGQFQEVPATPSEVRTSGKSPAGTSGTSQNALVEAMDQRNRRAAIPNNHHGGRHNGQSDD